MTSLTTGWGRQPPSAVAWRPHFLDKFLRRIEKAIDRLRYRGWFDGKELTTDWTSGNYSCWRRVLRPWRNEPLRILEVGSWEGRSALFFLNFFPRSTITCIDAFSEFPEIEGRFDRNLAPFRDRVEKIKSVSFPALDKLAAAGRVYDLVYIDADHRYDPVKTNTLGAWRLIEPGAVMIWDDYRWGLTFPPEQRPQTAIDALLQQRPHRVLAKNYQLIVECL